MKQYSTREAKARFSEVIKESCEITSWGEVVAVIFPKDKYDKMLETFRLQNEMIKELESKPTQTTQTITPVTTIVGIKMNDKMAAFLEKKTEKKELKKAVIGTNPFVSKCQMMYCKNTKNLEKTEIQEYSTDSGEYHKVEKWICPACKSKANKATYL